MGERGRGRREDEGGGLTPNTIRQVGPKGQTNTFRGLKANTIRQVGRDCKSWGCPDCFLIAMIVVLVPTGKSRTLIIEKIQKRKVLNP